MTKTASGTRNAIALAVCLMAVAALGLFAAACGSPTDGTAANVVLPTSETPKAGGTLTVAYLAQPESLDPARAEDTTERSIVHAVYQGLLQYDGKQGEDGTVLIPCLAGHMPSEANGGISADGRTYTFTLRRGVKFQPPLNRQVTSADVKYTLERLLRAAPQKTRDRYMGIAGAVQFRMGKAGEIEGVDVIDDATVRIRLRRADPSFLNLLADQSSHIVAREWVERWGEEFERHPLGTGPFVFLKWDPGVRIKLARNPLYWETGKPHVDAVDCELGLTPAAGAAGIRTGAVDALAYGLSADALADFTADSVLRGQVHSRPQLAASYLFMNTKRKPFDDVRVRRALAWAISRERLATLQNERLEALWQYYPAGLPGHESSTAFRAYSPAKARRLLAQAGYQSGLDVTLTVERGAQTTELVGALRNDLAAVGVNTRLEVLSTERYQRQIDTGRRPTLGVITWQASMPDPDEWVQELCSRRAAEPEGTNLSRWWSPALEEQRAKANQLPDHQARILAYQAMQRTIAAEVPYVPLVSFMQTSACSRQVAGFYLHNVYQLDIAQYWKK